MNLFFAKLSWVFTQDDIEEALFALFVWGITFFIMMRNAETHFASKSDLWKATLPWWLGTAVSAFVLLLLIHLYMEWYDKWFEYASTQPGYRWKAPLDSPNIGNIFIGSMGMYIMFWIICFKDAWEKAKSQPKAPPEDESSSPEHAFDYLKK